MTKASQQGQSEVAPKGTMVLAWLDGAKEHSGVSWKREGIALFHYQEALKKFDADYFDVVRWVDVSTIASLSSALEEATKALVLANAVVEKARYMPRKTIKPGSAHDLHSYDLHACDVWALDAAIAAYDKGTATLRTIAGVSNE